MENSRSNRQPSSIVDRVERLVGGDHQFGFDTRRLEQRQRRIEFAAD